MPAAASESDLPSEPVVPQSAAAARLAAKQRRSAERAAKIRERYLARHPPKHAKTHAARASDTEPTAATASSSHHATRKAATAHDDDDTGTSDDDTKSGRLRINTRPWSQVYVDGKLVGNTPLLGLELPAGKHTVRLVNEPMDLTKTISLKIKAGDTVTRLENLTE
jgi:serine/threonine-protein kinase